jgi:hypothetical protein
VFHGSAIIHETLKWSQPQATHRNLLVTFSDSRAFGFGSELPAAATATSAAFCMSFIVYCPRSRGSRRLNSCSTCAVVAAVRRVVAE